MPWKDEGFTRSAVAQKAAEDQIIDHTVREITQLNKESQDAQEND